MGTRCYVFDGYFSTTDVEPEGYVKSFPLSDEQAGLITRGGQVVFEDDMLIIEPAAVDASEYKVELIWAEDGEG